MWQENEEVNKPLNISEKSSKLPKDQKVELNCSFWLFLWTFLTVKHT